MINITSVVRDILYSSEDALLAMSNGYLNFSAYAKHIKNEVEKRSFKEVQTGSIVVGLSRIAKQVESRNPLETKVVIDSLTIKSPLVELVYDKTPESLRMLKKFYAKSKFDSTEFLTVTQGTSEITIICSQKTKIMILDIFTVNPKAIVHGLVALSVRFDTKYISEPNIIFSILRKVALKRVVLAEVVSTYTELTFLLKESDLDQIISTFRE